MSVLAFGGGFTPASRGGLDVVGEDLRKLVVAVELVLVLDASEGGGHVRSCQRQTLRHGVQQSEILVGSFDARPVMAGACSNHHVRCWHGDALRPRAMRLLVSPRPDLVGNRQFREGPGEIQ